MNLQENIQRIREMMGMDDSRLTFDIQNLWMMDYICHRTR